MSIEIEKGGLSMNESNMDHRNIKVTPKDYFKEDGNVREDLFVDRANDIAKSFSQSRQDIKGTQIRKFYDEVLRLKLKIDSSNNREERFKSILPYIKMLIPKVIYAEKRKTANEAFEDFIKSNIGGIENLEQFDVFCDFFEAVVAYSKE